MKTLTAPPPGAEAFTPRHHDAPRAAAIVDRATRWYGGEFAIAPWFALDRHNVVVLDGKVRVGWCTSIANPAAPTVAELNAGTLVTKYITPDGLSINPTTAKVDTSNLEVDTDTERAGRRAWAIKLKCHHDDTSDTAWNLWPYRTNGFLVIRRGLQLATTAWATGDKVSVYPLEVAEPDELDPAKNVDWDFDIEMLLTTAAQSRAIVA